MRSMRASKIAIGVAVCWTAVGAAAQVPGCNVSPPQVLEPESLAVDLNLLALSCNLQPCILSLVSDIDGRYLKFFPDPEDPTVDFTVRFTADPSQISSFSVRITSYVPDYLSPWTDLIALRNWQSATFEERPAGTVTSSDESLVTTFADVSCTEAAKYVSSTGEIELSVVSGQFLAGASEKWLEEIVIEIPPL